MRGRGRKAAVFGVVVCGGSAQQCLGQEQGGDREEEPAVDRWAGLSGTSSVQRTGAAISSPAKQARGIPPVDRQQ